MTTPAKRGGEGGGQLERAAPQKAIFQPGGFSLRQGGAAVAPRARLYGLLRVFAAGLFRTWPSKLGVLLFLAPAAGLGLYALIRTKIEAFAVPPAEHMGFVLGNLSLLFAIDTALLLLGTAATVAPILARDAWNGALLLYFSRPVLRSHYLLARVGSVAIAGTLLLLVPAVLLLVTQLLTFGLRPGGAAWQGWATPLMWPMLLIGLTIASAAAATCVALVGLACGVIVRSPSAAPLLLGGGVLGSLAVSWVLQAAWGRESFARALDLHHALGGFLTLPLWPLQPGDVPRFAVVDALGGVGVWVALAALAWLTLQRFLANPPLGKGRS